MREFIVTANTKPLRVFPYQVRVYARRKDAIYYDVTRLTCQVNRFLGTPDSSVMSRTTMARIYCYRRPLVVLTQLLQYLHQLSIHGVIPTVSRTLTGELVAAEVGAKVTHYVGASLGLTSTQSVAAKLS